MAKDKKKKKKIDKGLEEHLDGAENLELSKREAQAQVERELRNDAAEERERRRTAGRKPSGIEEVKADFVRVAESDELNPWGHEQRSLTRERYKQVGHWSLEDALKYGHFNFLKGEAGLNADQEGTRKLLLARTALSKNTQAQKYVDLHIVPYMDRFPELERATSKSQLNVFISDTHAFFADPFTVMAFFAFIEDAQPDAVIFGGDHTDATEISAHPSVPGTTWPLQSEFNHQRAFFEETYKLAPNTKMFLVESNHGAEVRMVRFVTSHARALSSLDSLQMDVLLGLKDLPVELVFRQSFLTKRVKSNSAVKRLYNKVAYTHGTSTAKNAAQVELNSWGMSGVSGHLHQRSVASGRTANLRHCTWTVNPGGVCDAVARHYIPGAGPAWQNGFTVIDHHNGRLQINTAICHKQSTFVNGWRYSYKGKLPTTPEAVTQFWIKRWNLKMN